MQSPFCSAPLKKEALGSTTFESTLVGAGGLAHVPRSHDARSSQVTQNDPLDSHRLAASSSRKIEYPVVIWFAITHLIALTMPFFFTTTPAIFMGLFLYFVTGCLGITLGYHRLLTHRSFKTPKWIERSLALCGVLAMQRGPLNWCSEHRMHHAGVDTEKDPHNARLGFWWSHLLWMCYQQPRFADPMKRKRFARDIASDPVLMFLEKDSVQYSLQILLAAGLFALGGLPFVVWGIFVRLAVTYHCTWFVNSATHKWGSRRYESDDLSRNCWWVAVLTFGEGWHNNHHVHQDVCPAAHRWYEWDLTWYIIWTMEALGLATNVRRPPPQKL